MKHTLPILALFTLHASLFSLPAAVPLRWTVETSRAQVAQFESYRGETLDLEATMKSYGSPLATPVQPSLYWQTNGMGAAWWTAPATASGNVLRATWSPTNDCGGTVYNCFIGGPNATYRAAFRLRMLPSPGFTPNHLPLPTVKAESDPVFSAWLATNELFSAVVDTNAVLGLITSATNGLATKSDLAGHVPARAETFGTDRLWTDATGVVWRVVRKYGPWAHSFEGDVSVKWWFWGDDQNGETGWVGGVRIGGRAGMPRVRSKDPDAVSVVWGDGNVPILSTRDVSVTTEAVGRVAYTNDIPDVSGYATPEDVSAATNGLATAESVDGIAAEVAGKADKDNVYTKEDVDSRYSALSSQIGDISNIANILSTTIDQHIRDTNNPHKVTAAQVGAYTTAEVDAKIGNSVVKDAENVVTGSFSIKRTFQNDEQSLSFGENDPNGPSIVLNRLYSTAPDSFFSGSIALIPSSGEKTSLLSRIKEYSDASWDARQEVESIVSSAMLPTDPTFSNAVLAVGLNIDTNSVDVLNEIAETFGGFPIGETATTVGGLLAALAAAVAWLKRNKVQTLKLEDNSVETSANGGVAKLDDFFTESNSLLTGTIESKISSMFDNGDTTSYPRPTEG